MKNSILLAVGLGFTAVAFAQNNQFGGPVALPGSNILIGAFDFDNLPSSAATQLSVHNARYSDIVGEADPTANPASAFARVYLNGQFGSSTWTAGNNGARGLSSTNAGGTSPNIPVNGTIISRPSGQKVGQLVNTGTNNPGEFTVIGALALNPRNNPGTDDFISFVFDSRNATDISISFAARSGSTNASYTLNWSVTNATLNNFVAAGSTTIPTGTTHNAYTVNFSAFDQLEGVSQAIIRLQAVNNQDVSQQVNIDNFQIIAGSYIPEPSAAAALIGAAALGTVALRRRRA